MTAQHQDHKKNTDTTQRDAQHNMTHHDVKKSATAEREEVVLDFWQQNNIFKKSLEKDSPKGTFVFYDGPPFATGLPHYGHLLAGTIKDVIPRYKTMQGYHVPRKWGWDCHGLPIENLVEKELGLLSKKEIEEYGIEKFNEVARDSVLRYEQEWKRYVPRSGRFIDMDDPYMSMQSNYMESVWWVFKQLHEKGLIHEGFKVMHWCPRCETALANFEVNQGYEDVTDISVTTLFELTDETNTYFLAWTTTPWTLPGNVALAVGADISYVKVLHEGKYYIVARELVENVFDEKEYDMVVEIPGSDLIGRSYQPVFDFYQKKNLEHSENGWKVYAADFVTTEDGTGIVHIASAFGSDDMELGIKHKLPFVQHVGKNGAFVDDFATRVDGGSFQGLIVKKVKDWTSTDIEIIRYLAQEGSLFSKKKIVHSYPHCWRCDTPLLNYATSSWFMDVPRIRERLMEVNKNIQWVPDHIGEGRFGKWLEGARDWALSRSRYWGTPLPVWKNTDGTKHIAVGSVAELLDHVKTSNNTYYGIRHGQSESNLTHIVNADPTTPNGLTELGRQQAEAEAEILRGKQIDYLIVSPFQRTQETAKIIQEKLGMSDDQIITDPRFRERNPGKAWEGRSWVDAHKAEEAIAHKDFWNFKLEADAESLRDVYQRVTEGMFDLEERYTGKNIVIVGHAGVLKTLQFMIQRSGNTDRALEYYVQNEPPKNADLLDLPFKPFPKNADYELDLHRPYIDECVLTDGSDEDYYIVGDVFDVWFDSGSMPYAQTHYPFEGSDSFQSGRFPANFIAEGLDQTRGWFYVMLVLGVALFDQAPYENVIVNGLVLAEDGKKMSKRLKNYPDIYHMFNSTGADALRLFLLASPLVRAEEVAFSEKGVQEVANKILGRMRNVVKLYQTYALEVDHQPSFDSEHVLDAWIAARTIDLVQQVGGALDAYELDKATRPFFGYVDDVSTWYIRRSRDRFKGEDSHDKQAALATTRMVLQVFAQTIAPFAPFIAEEIWQILVETDQGLSESVHLSAWPVFDRVADQQILDHMAELRDLVSQGLQLRSEAGIKVRQPLASFTAPIQKFNDVMYHQLITEELNVVQVIDGEQLSLDTNISSELQAEGDFREFLRGIQSLRKKMNFAPQDSVHLHVQAAPESIDLLQTFYEDLQKTAGVTQMYATEELSEGTEIKSGEHHFVVRLQQVIS